MHGGICLRFRAMVAPTCQLPGLKMAIPDAQYMAVPKVPVNACAPVVGQHPVAGRPPWPRCRCWSVEAEPCNPMRSRMMGWVFP